MHQLLEKIMNGKIKFHPAKSPAFNAGEVWVDSAGRKVEVVSIRYFGTGEKFDGQVIYRDDTNEVFDKDAWNFQVRYTHVADLEVR